MEENEEHTRAWYKEHFGVDPAKLSIPFRETKNPHYHTAAPMRLWREEIVLPFKSEEGIRKHLARKAAGIRAHETRKNRLIEWWKQARTDNPRVQEIVKRLWEIGEMIGDLHNRKQQCRETDEPYDPAAHRDYGTEHCHECENMTRTQNSLREERDRLFGELEAVCAKDKPTIQLARRYYRLEQTKPAEPPAAEPTKNPTGLNTSNSTQ